MTRKDYVRIATAFRSFRDTADEQEYYVIDSLACVLAYELVRDNERFDGNRFLDACGVRR